MYRYCSSGKVQHKQTNDKIYHKCKVKLLKDGFLHGHYINEISYSHYSIQISNKISVKTTVHTNFSRLCVPQRS